MKHLDELSKIKDSSLYFRENSAPYYSESNLKKSTTVEFLKTLYNYPPKFKIKLNSPQKSNHKIIGDFFNKIERKKYNLSDYINGFKTRLNTSLIHQESTSKILNYFNTVPVYVILNGSEEIVLGKTELNNFSQLAKSPVSTISKKMYDFCGSFEDKNLTRESNLGLFFLNKKDAENYIKELILKDRQGVNIKGVSINCISLLSAYNLMCEHHPGFDFRFIPDIKEVISLLEANRYTRNTMAVINFSNKPLDLILDKLGRLDEPVTSFYWDHLANSDSYPNLPINYSKQDNLDVWPGTPIYLVNLSNEKTTHIFLNYLKAKRYVDTTKDCIETINRGYLFESLPIAKNPAIQVASLENFLELYIQTEESELPMPKFVGLYGKQKEFRFNTPYSKKWQETILRKYRMISSFWSTMLYS
jgi:hypothetical protein